MTIVRVTTVLAFLFCSIDLAYAQPGYKVVESVDSMVTNTDLVCIAKVKEFEEVVVAGNVGRRKFRAVFAITQKMKAPNLFPTNSPRVFHVFSDPDELTRWQKQGCRLLLAVDLENEDNNHTVELDATNPQFLTAEFKLLNNSESILRAVKLVADTMPTQIRRIHTFELMVPIDVQSKMNSDQTMVLRVPADQRLEKKARTFLASNSPDVRSQGLRAIWFFKTKENIAAVRQLLDDPFQRPEFGDNENRLIYPVRHDAYNLLLNWNVDVEKPVLRNLDPKNHFKSNTRTQSISIAS